jgi:predicted AlkP superfamily pyrophosphatase or phosphodiesterase
MTTASHKKLLIVQAAGLARTLPTEGLTYHRCESVFPAVTCSVQASFRTASGPGEHGMVANGRYFRELHKVHFWEQSADLYTGERLWAGARQGGATVGQMFFQQSLGEPCELTLSPAPIHKHHGGIIDTCYAQPAGLYESLCKQLGRKFQLMKYWGPLASPKVGDWIADATAALLADRDRCPDILLTYLPTLDYDLQRYGPDDPRSEKSYQLLAKQLMTLSAAAKQAGYELLVYGDYAIAPATQAAYPNRALADAGLLATRRAGGRTYLDVHASRAFAVVDHEVAHVHVADPNDIAAVGSLLESLDGIEAVLDPAECGLAHANSGELILLASEGAWLAYPWWSARKDGPDYASHIDIHNKPGFDPCELFAAAWPPMSISQDASRIGGTHGRAGAERPVVFTTTLDLPEEPSDIVHLAQLTRAYLEET